MPAHNVPDVCNLPRTSWSCLRPTNDLRLDLDSNTAPTPILIPLGFCSLETRRSSSEQVKHEQLPGQLLARKGTARSKDLVCSKNKKTTCSDPLGSSKKVDLGLCKVALCNQAVEQRRRWLLPQLPGLLVHVHSARHAPRCPCRGSSGCANDLSASARLLIA